MPFHKKELRLKRGRMETLKLIGVNLTLKQETLKECGKVLSHQTM